MVLGSQYNLRSAVEARLYVKKVSLVDKHAGPKIDDLNAYLRMMLHQHIFRLEVAVYYPQFLQEGQRGQKLDCEGADVVHIERSKVVGREELVEIGG